MCLFLSRDNRKREMLKENKHENKEEVVGSRRRNRLGRSAIIFISELNFKPAKYNFSSGFKCLIWKVCMYFINYQLINKWSIIDGICKLDPLLKIGLIIMLLDPLVLHNLSIMWFVIYIARLNNVGIHNYLFTFEPF